MWPSGNIGLRIDGSGLQTLENLRLQVNGHERKLKFLLGNAGTEGQKRTDHDTVSCLCK